jgi:outer membrane lipoprotein-sorting protein
MANGLFWLVLNMKMRLLLLLLSLPLAAQQTELNQLAQTFRTLAYYSATFVSSSPTDVILNGVPQRQVIRRKVLVSGRKRRIEVIYSPESPAPINERIIIINDDQSWELTPAAKLVYISRSPQQEYEPKAVLLRMASQLKDAHFLPDETISLDEGPPHLCKVIEGNREVKGPASNQVFQDPVTYWIDRQTGLPVKVVGGGTILQIVSFTPNDRAALDESQYVYTPQPGWRVLEPR